MFIPTSVARMPSIRPAEPVMTPADRSNSPPIISSATATDGMPMVDATSVQLEMPSSFRNSEFWVQKKIAMTTAASSAPISGRRRIRAARLMLASRSSATGVGGGAASADVAALLMLSPGSPRARRRELRDGGGVALVDEARAREDRQAAADGVEVLLVEDEEHDRQVALEVLLLVDGELDVAGLDVLDDLRAVVERRQLRARARRLDRRLRRLGDVRVQGDDLVVGLVGLQLGLDLGLGRRQVRGALDLQVGDRPAE